MKTLLGMIAIGLALWFQPAVSAPWDSRPHLQQGQERRSAPRQAPPNKGERRQQRAAPAGDDRQRHRLSDEERRDLRRDLDRANRELYRRKGQR